MRRVYQIVGGSRRIGMASGEQDQEHWLARCVIPPGCSSSMKIYSVSVGTTSICRTDLFDLRTFGLASCVEL